jgi:hypothetical protein
MGNPGIFGSYGPLTSGYNDPNNPYDNAAVASPGSAAVPGAPGFGYGPGVSGTPPSAAPPPASQEQYGPATPPGFGLETYGPPVEGAFGPAGNYGYGSQPASTYGAPGTPFGGGVFGGVTPASQENVPGSFGTPFGGLDQPYGGQQGFGTSLGAPAQGGKGNFGALDDPYSAYASAPFGGVPFGVDPEEVAFGDPYGVGFGDPYGGYGDVPGGVEGYGDAAAAAAGTGYGDAAAAAAGTGYGDADAADAAADADAAGAEGPSDDDDDDDDDGE